MELKHREIPVEFLRHMPEGMKLVTRHGREFLVVEQAFSPSGTNLITDNVRIHHEPSIRFAVKIGESSGLLYVDAFWGSHAKLYGFIPTLSSAEHIVEAWVPETHESLMVDFDCEVEECNCRRGIELDLPGGENKILVCARLGCPGHRLELADLSRPVAEEISNINFFGAGSLGDDWFDSVD